MAGKWTIAFPIETSIHRGFFSHVWWPEGISPWLGEAPNSNASRVPLFSARAWHSTKFPGKEATGCLLNWGVPSVKRRSILIQQTEIILDVVMQLQSFHHLVLCPTPISLCQHTHQWFHCLLRKMVCSERCCSPFCKISQQSLTRYVPNVLIIYPCIVTMPRSFMFFSSAKLWETCKKATSIYAELAWSDPNTVLKATHYNHNPYILLGIHKKQFEDP